MELNTINAQSTWGKESDNLNKNFQKVDTEITKLQNSTYKNKGYFSTEEALKEAFPTASVGVKAYVGTSYPYVIWVWEDGAWTDSGKTGGDESLNLNEYIKEEDAVNQFLNKSETNELTILAAEMTGAIQTKMHGITWVDNKVINSSGNIEDSTYLRTTNLYPIPLGAYKISLMAPTFGGVEGFGGAFYNENLEFISRFYYENGTIYGYKEQSFDIPVNAAYFRTMFKMEDPVSVFYAYAIKANPVGTTTYQGRYDIAYLNPDKSIQAGIRKEKDVAIELNHKIKEFITNTFGVTVASDLDYIPKNDYDTLASENNEYKDVYEIYDSNGNTLLKIDRNGVLYMPFGILLNSKAKFIHKNNIYNVAIKEVENVKYLILE